MSARRGWIALALLAVGIVIAVAAWRAIRLRSAASEGEVTSEVPVRVGKVARATLRRYVVTFGTVEPEPAQAGRPAAGARAASPVTGVVAAVSCAEGQRVASGSVLVRLDTRVVDAQIAKAVEAVRFAELAETRQRTMLSSEATSRRALQEASQQLAAVRGELAAAQAERDLLVVRAPLSGTVVRLNARPGDAVDPSTVLVELVNLDRLVVSAGVRTAEAGLLRVGQEVDLSGGQLGASGTPAHGPVTGMIVFVGAQVDTKTDTMPVRVGLPPNSGLRPGEFLDVRIVAEERAGCLAVPEDAVVRTADGASAVAIVDGEKAVMRPVRTGLRDGGLVEIEGAEVKEGTTVVTEGAYGLPGETRIKVLAQ